MTETRVVNRYKEPYTTYIGRGSKWGNPYSHLSGTKAIYKVTSRIQAISCYRQYLWNLIKSGEVTRDDLLTLDGQILGCFCKPKSCHGDILVKAIEWAKRGK